MILNTNKRYLKKDNKTSKLQTQQKVHHLKTM